MRAELAAAALFLAACVQPGAAQGPSVGRLVAAGPVLGTSEKLTVRWRYGFEFSIDPKSVTAVKLSCGDIDGAAFVVTGDDILRRVEGTAVWYGPDLLMNEESVPWLFATRTTSAICQAVLTRDGLPDAVERMPVTFTKAAKRAAVIDLRNEHRDRKANQDEP